MKKIIEFDGMTCNHCVKAVEMELKDLDLESIQIEIGKAIVDYNPDKVTLKEIANAINEAGYKVIN